MVQEVRQINSYENVNLDVQQSDVTTAIDSYFKGFNDVDIWSKYSTDTFVRRVYTWCTGEDPTLLPLDEVKQQLKDIQIETADLVAYRIIGLNKINATTVELNVERQWSNEDVDQTAYSIVKVADVWKFDDRF